MDVNLTWNMEELQESYDKLGECIEKLKVIAESNEKSYNRLKENWITKKSQEFFEESEKVKSNLLKMINEYESAQKQLLKKIQVLREMDEE